MPDAATQRAVLEATRYLNSEEFRAQRAAILQANEVAQQRLGTQGLAAAERIAALRTAADGSQQRAAELIRSGQGTRILEEASDLAASPQVRETLKRADYEALVRLDEEQPEVPAQETEGEPAEYEDELLEVPKEVLLARYRRALLVLLPLHAALAIEAAAPGTSPCPCFSIRLCRRSHCTCGVVGADHLRKGRRLKPPDHATP